MIMAHSIDGKLLNLAVKERKETQKMYHGSEKVQR